MMMCIDNVLLPKCITIIMAIYISIYIYIYRYINCYITDAGRFPFNHQVRNINCLLSLYYS